MGSDAYLQRNRWTTCSSAPDLPCPEQPEASAMPSDDGLGFYNDENGPPVTPDRSLKAVPSEMVRAAIRPNVRIAEGEMDASDLCAGDDERV